MEVSDSLSLIVPAFNEEASIAEAIAINLEVLNKCGIPFELIIIDDGSRDRTKEIIEKQFLPNSNIIFFSKPNGGFGSAVKKGIELSKMKYIMFAPVDNPLDSELLSLFLSHIGKADLLISYRVAREGYSSRMKINSSVYQKLISFLFGLNLKDYNWIHLYKRSIFEKDVTIHYGGVFMLAEVIIKAKRAGYTFFEFPVTMQARKYGNQTAASFKAAWRAFRDVIKFFIFKT